MAIPIAYREQLVYHFTDIRNLKSIIENGLLCTKEKNLKGLKHVNIANGVIQERREAMDVTCGPKGKVHDYVPFYFSSINPMLLAVINSKNIDQQFIIYLCRKIDLLDKDDSVFTDASANTDVPPTFYDNPADLDKLSWNLIKSKKWSSQTVDDRHKKMAEVLVHSKVNISDIDYILVFNKFIKDSVEKIFRDCNASCPKVIFDNDRVVRGDHFYYTKFMVKGMGNCSLVTGPSWLRHEYNIAVRTVIKEHKKQKDKYPYKNIALLVAAIENNFNCIQELKDIDNLDASYASHKETVGEHTRSVVANLKRLTEYNSYSEENKSILLLAAYLHDIGKGPASKWENSKLERAYPDHPADAIPMVQRVLIDEVENVSEKEARKILMLVAYHNLIGECIGECRDEEQVVNIIHDIDDLNLLFSITKADTQAINNSWNMAIKNDEAAFSKRIEEKLKAKQA